MQTAFPSQHTSEPAEKWQTTHPGDKDTAAPTKLFSKLQLLAPWVLKVVIFHPSFIFHSNYLLTTSPVEVLLQIAL